jgi:multiple sugar transport system substrate-binding protein
VRKAERHHGCVIPFPRDDWTLEEFHALAGRLTIDFDGDGQLDQFGFWLPRWVYYLPFLWAFGAEITDEAMSCWKLIGPEATAAFAFYHRLAVAERVCPRDEEAPQLFQDVGFLTGRTAMCVNGPWFQPFLAQTKLASSYRVHPVPRGPAGRFTRITWDALVMAPNLPRERREAAGAFLRFAAGAEAQRRLAQTGRALPSRRDALSAYLGQPADERRRVFVDSFSYSRTQPLLRRFGELDRAVNRALERLIQPSSPWTPEAILQSLAQDPEIVNGFSECPDAAP